SAAGRMTRVATGIGADVCGAERDGGAASIVVAAASANAASAKERDMGIPRGDVLGGERDNVSVFFSLASLRPSFLCGWLSGVTDPGCSKRRHNARSLNP